MENEEEAKFDQPCLLRETELNHRGCGCPFEIIRIEPNQRRKKETLRPRKSTDEISISRFSSKIRLCRKT